MEVDTSPVWLLSLKHGSPRKGAGSYQVLQPAELGKTTETWMALLPLLLAFHQLGNIFLLSCKKGLGMVVL